ncbi:MAG: 2-C-methyl-D-erythritol 4-phosphate cytidylyltransferase [Lachnospiraceae bacterium]|nr:2-C-methyl-D-erythritol 4-phosphate cytidylyltransferase [Lachnospiraceae bacterium]
MIFAVVLAGGSGKRFGGDTPKQYRELFGKPVIAWSLQAFEKSSADGIVLVCAEKDIEYCRRDIVEKYGISKCKAIVPGGENRYDSVYCGLKAAAELAGELHENEHFCMIHDGARPCIDTDTVNEAADYVVTSGSCVVGVKVTDTIQIVNDAGDICMTPDRAHTWAAQTPQCFELSNALNSYKEAVENRDETITDDASAVRKYGSGSIYMLQGKKENIKITTEDDLQTAEKILRERLKENRVSFLKA